MTERDEDPLEMTTGIKSLVKRKGAKGINHFSYCDRATQTTVPPIRVKILNLNEPTVIFSFHYFIKCDSRTM
jgi:hypothetical protein